MSDLLRSMAELRDTTAELIADSKRMRERSRLLVKESAGLRAARRAADANRPTQS